MTTVAMTGLNGPPQLRDMHRRNVIGALVRHTAGAIIGIIGFVLSSLTQLIPSSLGNHIRDYLPSEAGSLIASPRQGAGDLLGPWQGFGVLCRETAVLIVVAAYPLRRRDA